MIECIEKENETPVCPHCNAVLNEVWFRAMKGFLGRRYLYFCPQCKKVLGVTHRKGFWMG
ncbi:MAG: hypothetical protein K9N48_04640 [Verrucomicrobia bacterium]|nr:hypothetical protein [Verrucomicrobiota bacterium]MCF7708418.1 hypothetical protein [Verrucomicrobiota bacterium]